MEKKFKPFVDPGTEMKELTFRAVLLGVIMAMVLGGANTYLGLKAGMTVAATFPAAVIAMAVLRFFRGTILEENIARTTGAVGEALAAGAIFTIPAFMLGGKNALWPDLGPLQYLQGTLLLLLGGILGVLFVILLRRTFMEDTSLPFPESVACNEIVKAGQGGSSGAGLVFGSMGLAAVIEIFKNGNGIPVIGEKIKGLFTIGGSGGGGMATGGTFPYMTPASSPAFLGVGYIIGPRLAAWTFAGGVFGWLFLMPVVLVFVASAGGSIPMWELLVEKAKWPALFGEGMAPPDLWQMVAAYMNNEPYRGQAVNIGNFLGDKGVLSAIYAGSIKNIAIGAMIVGAFFTLYKMRSSLVGGIVRSFRGMGGSGSKDEAGAGDEAGVLRTERDLSFGKVLLFILLLLVGMFGIYFWLTKAVGVSLVTTIVMAIAGFLFAAVAGYLVAIIGSSSNPISGLTLSTLLLAAGLLVVLGMKGNAGIIAVLGVATVVCCVAGVAGDMIQDWKVGHLLGGTPWKMQVGGLIGVVAAALVLIPIILLLHKYGGGIGKEGLDAPQAVLMHKTATGIIGGTMPWAYIVLGMLFAFALILLGVPSPMLIAVGMYLPFFTTAAIFVGGIIKWIADRLAQRRFGENKKALEMVENRGLLVASGLVAGEAMVGIILAGVVATNTKLFCDAKLYAAGKLTCLAKTPTWFHARALGLVVIVGLAIFMISMSIKGVKGDKDSPPPPDATPDEEPPTEEPPTEEPPAEEPKAEEPKAEEPKAE